MSSNPLPLSAPLVPLPPSGSVVDPDPNHFGTLDPHKFADDKPKCMEYEPILALFQVSGFSLYLEARI